MSPDSLIPALADMDELNVDSALQLASEVATVNLLYAQQELGRRIVDPNVTSRALLDIAEHSYKVSGMQKKQEPKAAGERFSITINIPQIGAKPPETLVIEASPEALEDAQNTPETLVKEAAGLIDWETTPEFS